MSKLEPHSPSFTEQTWHRIPGWSQGEIFAIVIRPGIVCSNSYLIDTERAMIVIDPGTDAAQFALINRVLAERPGADDKPMLVLLTHCHHDHSHGADRLRRPARAPNLLLLEASGAQALIDGNRQRTLAFLYPENPAVCRRAADAALFSHGASDNQLLYAGPAGDMRLTNPAALLDDTLPRQQMIDLGGGDCLLFHRTPGHTPCSICIQAGELLFVGDLPFAADPGLIGLDGWDQRTLLGSLEAVERLIDDEGIGQCLPGHGLPIPTSLMRQTLRKMHAEASRLTSVDALDEDRVANLKEFASELLEEAEYLFSVISGRLFAASHHLAALEESEQSKRFAEAVDFEKIDRVLAGFRSFHEEFRAAGQPTLSLVMKGAQAARAIERVFDAPRTAALLDPPLIRRASRLLSDYLALVRGLRLDGAEPTSDIGAILTEVIDTLDMKCLDDAGFINHADDDTAYLTGLVARLTFPPIFRKVRVRHTPMDKIVAVAIHADRVSDLLLALLESVAAAGPEEIVVSSQTDGERVSIHINGGVRIDALSPRRADLARRWLAPCGGSLRQAAGELIIEMPILSVSP